MDTIMFLMISGYDLIHHFSSANIPGLEPDMVHTHPWTERLFSEHSAGLGAVYLPVALLAVLLPSSLLPWSRTPAALAALQRQAGEWVHD